MAVSDRKIQAFTKGTHNLFDDELINDDAFSDSLGWVTKDGHFELARGRALLGDIGVAGSVSDIHTGFRVDGDPVYFKKSGTTVKALVSGVWTDAITGLTEDAPTRFANYSSLAGAFVFVFSTDGIWKICTANPTSSVAMYDESKNFKGIAFIDKGRTILWGREADRTGLYGSKIDPQNSTVYTTVSAEAIGSSGSTNYTGTLAFKGSTVRTCFGVSFTDGNLTLRDDYNGGFTGDGTGTINYATGVYDVTFNSTTTGAVTSNYQWENSNVGGITDFSKAFPRAASEGFQFPQDIDGDEIKVVIPLDSTYFSFKERSVYTLTISDDDTDATNQVFRTNIGTPTSKSAVATSKGIIYVDTANSDDVSVKILGRNPLGDNFDVQPIFAHFNFSDYLYDDCALFSYGNYVLVACKTKDATSNDRILLCDVINNTVDILPFNARCFTQFSGNLYSGDSLSTSAYATLNGFDDLEYTITNYAVSKGDTYGVSDLKKLKKLRFRGLISTNQQIQVYGSFDRSTYTLLGTIDGGANYVDTENPNTVGLNIIGADVIGGSDSEVAYPYLMEMKIKTPKFRKRYLKFIATSYGYASINTQEDFDIWIFENKLPKSFRQKQNVSLDGETTDLANPDY